MPEFRDGPPTPSLVGRRHRPPGQRGTSPAAAQVGGREALAPAAPGTALGPEPGAPAGGALLWWSRGRTGSSPGAGAAERREPPRRELLPLAPARTGRGRAHGERRDALLRPPRALQRPRPRRTGREPGGGGALLLPEPHRIQRALPLQPQGGVQRALRPPRPHPLRARLPALPGRAGGVDLPMRRLRDAGAGARRLSVRGPALRRAVRGLLQGRVLLGRPGAAGALARPAPGPRGRFQPSDGAGPEALP